MYNNNHFTSAICRKGVMPRNKKDLHRAHVGITIYTSLPELMHTQDCATQDQEVGDVVGRLCKLEGEYSPPSRILSAFSVLYEGGLGRGYVTVFIIVNLHFNIQWFSNWTDVCSRAPTCSMTSSCECSVSKSLIRSCRTCGCNSWWHVLI